MMNTTERQYSDERVMEHAKTLTYEESLAGNASSVEPPTIVYQTLKSIAIFLSIYFTPAITVVGTIGNILSVVVFMRTKLKKLSSSYYLAFLAIFDTGFLWCYFVSVLNQWNFHAKRTIHAARDCWIIDKFLHLCYLSSLFCSWSRLSGCTFSTSICTSEMASVNCLHFLVMYVRCYRFG